MADDCKYVVDPFEKVPLDQKKCGGGMVPIDRGTRITVALQICIALPQCVLGTDSKKMVMVDGGCPGVLYFRK